MVDVMMKTDTMFEKDSEPQMPQTLLQALGFDMEGQYSKMMQEQCLNDTMSISIGGRSDVGSNQLIVCRYFDNRSLSNFIYNGIAFFIKPPKTALGLNGKFLNGLQILRFFQFKYGSYTYSMADGDIYNQMRLELMNYADGKVYEDALIMNNDNVDSEFANVTGYAPCFDKLMIRQTLTGDLAIYIPWALIIPSIQSFPDQQIYTSQQCPIEISCYTVPYKDCFVAPSNAGDLTVDYVIYGASLIKQYAFLEEPQHEIIKRNEFIYNPTVPMNFISQKLTSQMNFQFTIAKGEKVKRFVWCFAPSKGTAYAQRNLSTLSEVFSENYLSSKLFLMYKLNVIQLKITGSGDSVTIPYNQIAIKHKLANQQTGNSLTGYKAGLKSGLIKDLRTVYCQDLSRFGEDLIGSTSKEQVTFTVQVYVELNSTAYPHQSNLLACNKPGNFPNELALTALSSVANLSDNVNCYGFLEITQKIALRNDTIHRVDQ